MTLVSHDSHMHFVYHGDSGNHVGSEILTADRGTLRAPSPTGSSHCIERKEDYTCKPSMSVTYSSLRYVTARSERISLERFGAFTLGIRMVLEPSVNGLLQSHPQIMCAS